LRGETCNCCTAFCTALLGDILPTICLAIITVTALTTFQSAGIVKMLVQHLQVMGLGDAFAVAHPRTNRLQGKALGQFRLPA
jgi:hypothetical protein